MKPQKRRQRCVFGGDSSRNVFLSLFLPLFLSDCCSDLSCLLLFKFHLCLSWWLFNGAVYFLYGWSIFVPEYNNADECTWPYLSAHCSVSLCLVPLLFGQHSLGPTCHLGHVHTNVNKFDNVFYTLKNAGVDVFQSAFEKFAINTEIPQQREHCWISTSFFVSLLPSDK